MLLHLQEITERGADEFVATTVDYATEIRFRKNGKGHLQTFLEDGSQKIFPFDLPELPRMLSHYEIGAMKWHVRQHVLPSEIQSRHPLQRFYTFSYPGAPFEVCGFSPALTTERDAARLLQKVHALAYVITPQAPVGNFILIHYLENLP